MRGMPPPRRKAELRLGEAAKSALEKAERMKAAAENALVKAGHEVFDATRRVEDARAQAKAIIAEATARSAEADKRLAAADQAEQDLLKERAVVRAAEKAAASTKREYEAKRAGLSAKVDRLIAELVA
jgi:flotillin